MKKFKNNDVFSTKKNNFTKKKRIDKKKNKNLIKKFEYDIRFKKANVTIEIIDKTFSLNLINILKSNDEKNNNISKGSIIVVQATRLGLITRTGLVLTKICAKVTNNPLLDGYINAIRI